MRDASALRSMTVEEYFRFEEDSPIRHEYVAGEVYAMSGATVRHNLIAGTIFTQLFAAADVGPCRVFMNAMRVEVAGDRYYYPDVAVICSPIAELDVVARGPCVVVEVTSPSTARIDRGEKLEAYRRMSRKAGKIWREFGALEYRECVEDDVKMGKLTSFPRSVKLKPNEVVVFSWIVFKSRAQRDRINAKVMKDPRLAGMMDPKKVPFDVKRMIYGGFKVSVEV